MGARRLAPSLDTCTGFILDKRISVNCPRKLENAKIMVANTCALASIAFTCWHPDKAHSDGHGQDQDLWRPGQGRWHWQARRARASREGASSSL